MNSVVADGELGSTVANGPGASVAGGVAGQPLRIPSRKVLFMLERNVVK